MAVLALAERIGRGRRRNLDETRREHQKVVYRVKIGKQVFIVTCQEAVPDKEEPAL